MERGKKYDWIIHKERSGERDGENERDERDKERRLRRDDREMRNERNERDEDKDWWRRRNRRNEINERDEERRRRRDGGGDGRDGRDERGERDGRDTGKHWKQIRDERSERNDMDRERMLRRDRRDKRDDKGRRDIDEEGMRGRDERNEMDDRDRERARRGDQRCERSERGKDMDWRRAKGERSERDREREKEKKASRYERDNVNDGGDRDKERRERRYERNEGDETDKERGTRARRGGQEMIGGRMDEERRNEWNEKDEKVKKWEEKRGRKGRKGNKQRKGEEVEESDSFAQVRQSMVTHEALGKGKLVDAKGKGRTRREVKNNVLDDPALDFFSPEFDALKALMTTGLQPPNPQAHPLDNLQKCKHLLPQELQTDGDVAPCRPRRTTDARSKESVQAQARAKAHQSSHAYLLAKKAAKQAKVLDAIADKLKGGPLEMLARCYSEKGRVQVWTRHAKGVRGSCVGFLEAVDKHMDMVLRDVDETYHVLTHVPRTVTVRVRVKPKPQPDAAEKDKASAPVQAVLSPLPEQSEHEPPICSIDDVCALWDTTEGKLGNSPLDSSMGCEKESGSGGGGDWEQMQEYKRQQEEAPTEGEGEKFTETGVGEKEVEERTGDKRQQQEGSRHSRGEEEVTEDGPDARSVQSTLKNEVEVENDDSFSHKKEDEVEVRMEQRVKYFRKLEHRKRHLKQVFIRGDSVVLIRVV